MTNYGCIAVGINRYQFVEPLSHAEADAQGLVKFLVEELGVPGENCLLATDAAPPVVDRSAHPSYANLTNLFNSSPQSLNNPDWLWCFFSGHGVHWRGEDYLLPIDGSLEALPQQAISARTLLTSLKQQGKQVLLLLDINRSPGLGTGTPVGSQFSKLAQELGINLIQSVSNQECSYERRELGRGLFAQALGEALSYHRQQLTLQTLCRYLVDRLPELGNHHGTPPQHPLIQLAPNVDLEELILPAKNFSRNGKRPSVVAAVGASSLNNNLTKPIRYRSGTETPEVPPNKIIKAKTKIQPPSTAIQPPSTKIQPGATSAVDSSSSSTPNSPAKSTSSTNNPPTSKKPKSMANKEKSNSALPWIGGATLLFLLMVFGVLWRNLDAFVGDGQTSSTTPTLSPSVSPEVSPAPTTAILPSPVPTNPNPAPTTAISPSPAVLPSPVVSPTPVANSSPAVSSPLPSPTTATTATSAANRQQANQVTLESARSILRSDQATQFGQAIQVASQVQPSDPLYKQAQGDISRWSTVIMDMAHGRSTSGDWTGAITTAQTVPPVNKAVYQDAQAWISRWQQLIQQRDANLQQIQKARRLIRPNQANSYRQAIDTNRAVPTGQPGYELAQELINTWSLEIWQMAQQRANGGNFQGAIAAAEFLPENTSLRNQAQTTIALWQQGKKAP